MFVCLGVIFLVLLVCVTIPLLWAVISETLLLLRTAPPTQGIDDEDE
jgi:hypothetical protein